MLSIWHCVTEWLLKTVLNLSIKYLFNREVSPDENPMREGGTIKVALILGLVVSMIVNAIVLWDDYRLRLSKGELEQKYSDLEASFLGLFDDPFSPPVSKLQAILIALEHGGWKSSNLRGLVVTAVLQYMRFWSDGGAGGEVLHEVRNPVSDYSSVVEGDTTYRYVWCVTVREPGPGRTIPPPGFYIVDAATGEIVPYGMR